MRAVAGAILLSLCGLASAAPKRYEPAAQHRAMQTQAVIAGEAQLRVAVAQRDAAALANLAGQWLASSEVAPLEAEYLLSQWLEQVRALAPDALTRARVEELARYRAKALTPSPEPHRASDTWVPLYDVGSLAQGVLRGWTLDARIPALADAIARGDLSALATDDAEALDAAITRSSPSSLARLRAASIALPSRAKLSLARRLLDANLYAEIFAGSIDEFVFTAIAEVTHVLAERDARTALEAAARRPELVSAATLAMGPLLGTDELLACLPDPARGGSCAQLLAQRSDAATIDALRQLARGDDLAARRARLALQWAAP